MPLTLYMAAMENGRAITQSFSETESFHAEKNELLEMYVDEAEDLL